MVGKFVRLKCNCKNEQVVFTKASSVVTCLVCGAVLAEPTGGIANLKVPVIEEFE